MTSDTSSARVRPVGRAKGGLVVAVFAVVAASALVFAAPPLSAAASSTELISVSTSGLGGDGDSSSFASDLTVSADGRFVAFTSYADDLVAGDSNGTLDVFVRDRQTGTTQLAGLDNSSAQGSSYSYVPFLSALGRYVAFTSNSALVPDDTNGTTDAYVRDLVARTTTLASVADDGTPLAASPGGSSSSTSISGDGRFVVFTSDMPPLGTGLVRGVFVRDRDPDGNGVYDELGTGTTTRVDVASDGTPGTSGTYNGQISSNGRYVAYSSTATNLATPDDPICQFGGCSEVFLHDRDADEDGVYDEPGAITTTMASVTSVGAQADNDSGGGSVSNAGDVVFWSYAPNLGGPGGRADAYLHDHATQVTSQVGTSISNLPVITPNGQFVGFDSFDQNGVVADSNNTVDVFVLDRVANSTTRASVDSSGAEIALGGFDASLSADGRFVAFGSYATSLLPAGSVQHSNAFLRDTNAGTTGAATGVGTVQVAPVDPVSGASPVTIDFANVTSGGVTTLTTTMNGPPPPSGFTVQGTGIVYDLSTSATFSGTATVCFSYDPSAVADPNGLRLLHYLAGPGQWQDITTSNNEVTGQICGVTRSFSPFAIFGSSVPPYQFSGFEPPVQNPPKTTTAKPGSAVPLKFGLGGSRGPNIFSAGYPRSSPANCTTWSATGAAIPTSSTAPLTVGSAKKPYNYVWKTDKTWSNTCRLLEMRFNDGTTAVVRLKFSH